jgi:predicted GH43/DUF377 family glycosyl hydrolase
MTPTPLLRALRWLPLLLLPLAAPAKIQPETYDVVVYGGTSAGVTAAVEAGRLRQKVVLIEPSRHLGGLTSGGLGATDIGRKYTIGGLSREFYRRVKKHYADPAAWKHQKPETFKSNQHDPAEEEMYYFEPHVAEKIFNDMAREAKVTIVHGERLDLQAGVVKSGPAITEIVMESGRRFRGRVFIDATYEGDLMAKAGVAYRVGRESSAEYGETHAGNQPYLMRRNRPNPSAHDFRRAVDPYVVPGDPASGLIFGVHPGGPGRVGQGDNRVQAYCFRLCLTNVPENRVPFAKPAGYDPARYELIARYLNSTKMLPDFPEGGDIEHPVLGNNLTRGTPVVIMPNGKSDSNNKDPVGFNLYAGNYDYADADYATREKIIQDHVDWQQGLIWFMATDERVPAKYREPMKQWGLPKDEFTDNGHWPHQLYVREARRMVGEYVMTQRHCDGSLEAPDSVAMGSYAMDSHNMRRYVDENGHVRVEGTIGLSVRDPYTIAYGALTPKRDECTNLLVPVCLSATHVAYGSIRMEPVFMMLGHAAGAAAVQAIERGVTVQEVDYPQLKARLNFEGQITQRYSPPVADRRGRGRTGPDSWMIGPFAKRDDANPVLGPLDTRWDCPVLGQSDDWESYSVYNPTAVVRDGKIHLLYRAHNLSNRISRVGLATSEDGVTFRREKAPVFFPEKDAMQVYESRGIEDPRVIEAEDGRYYLTYTAYDRKTARLCVASSSDLRTWTKHGLAFGQAHGGRYVDVWSKAGAIVGRRVGDRIVATRINGKYWMYWCDKDIYAATSDDLINWTPVELPAGAIEPRLAGGRGFRNGFERLQRVLRPRSGKFDSDIIESGPAALLTERGIVLIYNARNLQKNGDQDLPDTMYTVGQALLSQDNPLQVIDRAEKYFLKPEKEYEMKGYVGLVVFAEALVPYKDKWFLYYGTADTKIGVAEADAVIRPE